MRGCAWFYTRTRTARNGSNHDIILKDTSLSQRQQAQLYGRSKTTGIGHQTALLDALTLPLGKAIDIAL